MDPVDRRILDILSDDARTSFSDLGRQVGLSINAAAARVRRLERAGVIRGYTVVRGDADMSLRPGLEVYIDVRLDPAADYEAGVTALRSLPAVVDAVHVTGAYDYLVRAFVPDTSSLDALLRSLKRDCGASHTQTRIAMRGA